LYFSDGSLSDGRIDKDVEKACWNWLRTTLIQMLAQAPKKSMVNTGASDLEMQLKEKAKMEADTNLLLGGFRSPHRRCDKTGVDVQTLKPRWQHENPRSSF
jgi:hypothetical protein